MANVVASAATTAPPQPQVSAPPTAPAQTSNPSGYTKGDTLVANAPATPAPAHRKTLAEKLTEVGSEPKEGANIFAKLWNWMNQPNVEAAREFGSAFLHNGPALIFEMSKTRHAAEAVGSAAAAGAEVATAAATGEAVSAGAGAVATAGRATAVFGKVGKAAQAAGSSGIMAVLAKAGAVSGTIGGVIQLLRDMVQCETAPGSIKPLEKGLLLTGGFIAATGSAVALCGGALPGAVMGLMGMLIHATGLVVKSHRIEETKIDKAFDPDHAGSVIH